jgi:alkylhydroperoxidase family enzyme
VASIRYGKPDEIPPEDRVPDQDNILRIHGVHARLMRLHYDLYRELMHGPGPLSRVQREMLAVRVSAANGCHY